MATFVDLYGILIDRELGSLDTTLFTTVRRKAALNEAQREFVRLTGCLTRQANVALTDAQAEYDLESVIAADDFLALTKDGVQIKKDDGTTISHLTGEDLPRRDIPWLDRYDRGWRAASAGTPRAYGIREDGGETFLFFTPAPDIPAGDTWTAIVPYIAYPSDMTADADEPFTVSANAKKTLRLWHHGLAHFAAARLELLRKNYQAYDRQMQLFNTYVTDYLQKQRRPGGQHVTMERDYLGEVSSTRISGIASDWWLR